MQIQQTQEIQHFQELYPLCPPTIPRSVRLGNCRPRNWYQAQPFDFRFEVQPLDFRAQILNFQAQPFDVQSHFLDFHVQDQPLECGAQSLEFRICELNPWISLYTRLLMKTERAMTKFRNEHADPSNPTNPTNPKNSNKSNKSNKSNIFRSYTPFVPQQFPGGFGWENVWPRRW